jgi:hypothetical protein
MSGTLDLFNQNLTRAQALAGGIQTASQAIRSNNLSNAGRAAIAGSLITQLGGILGGNRNAARPPERGFNVSQFMSSINKMGGLSGASKFLVNITPPPCFRSGSSVGNQPSNLIAQSTGLDSRASYKNIAGDLVFLCPKTEIPGVTFTTAPIRRLGYGTQEAVPVGRQVENIRFNFFVDVSGITYSFFTKWLGNIVNFNSDATGTRTSDGAFYNEVHYKDNYATPINIYVFDTSGNSFMDVQLIDAYPISISPVDLSWGAHDDIAMVSVTFAYKNWKSNHTTPAQIGAGSLRNLSLASTLMRGGAIVQAASSLLRRPNNVTDVFNLVRNGSGLISSLTR